MPNPTPVNVAKPQFLIYRKIDTLSYTAFDQNRFTNLDRLHGIRFIDLHMDLQIDGSGGSADGALLTGAPFHFLKKIILKGNGKEPIFDESGYGLYLKNFFDYGVAPTSSGTAASTGSANAQFTCVTRLDLAQPWGKVPVDTALISSLFNMLQLSVEVGTPDDEIVNATNDRVMAFDTLTIDVYVGEIVNFRADLFGRIIAKHYYIEDIPTATTPNRKVELATGNQFRSLLIEVCTEASGANPTPVDTVLNNVQVKNGNEVLLDAEDDILRRIPAMERGIATQTGAYFIDFSRDGLLNENLDATQQNNVALALDVTLVSNNRIRVHAVELIPV